VAQQGGGARSIEGWLRERHPECGSLHEAGLVHRLDAGTSGCLVAARSSAAHARLRAAFQGGGSEARKVYLAVVRAGLAREGRLALHFSSRHRGSAKVTVRAHGEPRERGACEWRVLGPALAAGHEIVEVRLIGPGRRHQIRAGLAHMGHPLLGDTLYGGAADVEPHAALHAWRVTVEGTTVEAEPPPRFVPRGQP
jgi:23S rRNA pseudouridine1911/1915/1917 synthase